MSASAMSFGLALPRVCMRAGKRATRVAQRDSGFSAVRDARLLQPCAATLRMRNLAAVRQRSVVVRAAVSEPQSETFTYQAEVNRLMDLIVNSLYSNKDVRSQRRLVFLRELVSNASDALDKIRFLSVKDSDALKTGSELVIRIKADKAAKTLTIEDTGVGMTKEELVDSLGTIARSGTAKFMEAVKQSAAADGGANLIGRFGVGFYSAFLVADRITVTTKSNADSQAWEWESQLGASTYTVREAEGAAPARGTRVVLHLKEEAEELLDAGKVSSLVRTYSEFISFPIQVWASASEAVQKPDDAATEARRKDWEARRDAAAAKGEAFEEAAPGAVTKTEYEESWEWKVQNEAKPIWMRSSKEVAAADYNEFFKTTFKEFLDPLAQAHFTIEGDIEFRSILYVPGMAPFDQQDMMRKSRSLKLYVRRVFISDSFDEDLMPRYLGFIKGVVDSNDLPLNVSREILQESKVVRVMRKRLLRKSLDMLKEIKAREDAKDWGTFWEAFGRNLKLGVIEDSANRDELAALCQFSSSKSGEGQVGLPEYVARMQPEQKAIFYLAADSAAAAQRAPFLEALAKKGLEVLFLTDPIDEVVMTNLGKFDGRELVDITKEGLDLGDAEDKAAEEEQKKAFAKLGDWMLGAIGGAVESVGVSARLTDAPCVLVTSKYGWSANMERIMKSQTMGDARAMEYMKGKKIMEVNPTNGIILRLKEAVEAGTAGPAEEDAARLLYDTSLLNSGFSVEDPAAFSQRIFALMNGGGGAGSTAQRVSAEVVGQKESGTW